MPEPSPSSPPADTIPLVLQSPPSRDPSNSLNKQVNEFINLSMQRTGCMPWCVAQRRTPESGYIVYFFFDTEEEADGCLKQSIHHEEIERMGLLSDPAKWIKCQLASPLATPLPRIPCH